MSDQPNPPEQRLGGVDYYISRSVTADGEPIHVLTRNVWHIFGSIQRELARNKDRAVLERAKAFLENKDE